MPSLRYLAPAGAPINAADVAHWCAAAFSGEPAGQRLERVLAERFGVGQVSLFSTGRAGMTVLLRAMRRLGGPARREVVMPAYTCYSVAASAIKAGLQPRLIDISPESLDFAPHELESVDFSRVLAIVGTNLYGLPNDMAGLRARADRAGVFLIDDAAQSMGARVKGRWSGTWGDAGLLSFDKGKNVSAIDGGAVLVASKDLNDSLRDEMATLERPSLMSAATQIGKALAYAALLPPSLYWLPARTPQLGLGRTVFTTDFPLAHPEPALSALAVAQMRHLEEFTEARRRNARALLEGLAVLPGVSTVTPLPDTEPVYLRLPVLVDDPGIRNAALTALKAAGIGATGSYPLALNDVPELAAVDPDTPAPGARRVARSILTLPTHPYMTPRDIALALQVLGDTLVTAGATSGAPAMARP